MFAYDIFNFLDMLEIQITLGLVFYSIFNVELNRL